MSDSHEEQLLSDLIGEMRREDAALSADHLEARVVGAWQASPRPQRVVSRTASYVAYLAVGAAAALLLFLVAPSRVGEPARQATEVVVDPGGAGVPARTPKAVGRPLPAGAASARRRAPSETAVAAATEAAPLQPTVVAAPVPDATV